MVKKDEQLVVGCEPCKIYARVITDSKPNFPCPECQQPIIYIPFEEFVKTHQRRLQEQEMKKKLRIQSQTQRRLKKKILRILEEGKDGSQQRLN